MLLILFSWQPQPLIQLDGANDTSSEDDDFDNDDDDDDNEQNEEDNEFQGEEEVWLERKLPMMVFYFCMYFKHVLSTVNHHSWFSWSFSSLEDGELRWQWMLEVHK